MNNLLILFCLIAGSAAFEPAKLWSFAINSTDPIIFSTTDVAGNIIYATRSNKNPDNLEMVSVATSGKNSNWRTSIIVDSSFLKVEYDADTNLLCVASQSAPQLKTYSASTGNQTGTITAPLGTIVIAYTPYFLWIEVSTQVTVYGIMSLKGNYLMYSTMPYGTDVGVSNVGCFFPKDITGSYLPNGYLSFHTNNPKFPSTCQMFNNGVLCRDIPTNNSNSELPVFSAHHLNNSVTIILAEYVDQQIAYQFATLEVMWTAESANRTQCDTYAAMAGQQVPDFYCLVSDGEVDDFSSYNLTSFNLLNGKTMWTTSSEVHNQDSTVQYQVSFDTIFVHSFNASALYNKLAYIERSSGEFKQSSNTFIIGAGSLITVPSYVKSYYTASDEIPALLLGYDGSVESVGVINPFQQ